MSDAVVDLFGGNILRPPPWIGFRGCLCIPRIIFDVNVGHQDLPGLVEDIRGGIQPRGE